MWSLAQLLSSRKQEGLVGDSALGTVLGEPMGLRQLSQAALCSVAPSCAEPCVEEDTEFSVSAKRGEDSSPRAQGSEWGCTWPVTCCLRITLRGGGSKDSQGGVRSPCFWGAADAALSPPRRVWVPAVPPAFRQGCCLGPQAAVPGLALQEGCTSTGGVVPRDQLAARWPLFCLRKQEGHSPPHPQTCGASLAALWPGLSAPPGVLCTFPLGWP